MSRKKLIAIGCSYTKMSRKKSLAAIGNRHWPEYLAEKLDMNCVNLGAAGQGNEYILSKLIDTVLSEKNIGLVVLMWSEWIRQDFQDPANGWYFFHPHKDKSRKERYPIDLKSRNSILQYNDPYNLTMKSLRYFLMSQMLLKDIPYLMIQGTSPLQNMNEKTAFKLVIAAMVESKIFNEINPDQFIGWPILKQIGGYTVGDILNKIDPEQKELRISKDDTHPNAEGHKIMSQEIYNAYEKIYT
tara:strand:+ start:162 stop:890 length:729 start_codon:yes stop_codon:yes gene_type:complete